MREKFDVSGYPEAERLDLAGRFLAGPFLMGKKDIDIITTTPKGQDLPYEETRNRMAVVNQANAALGELRILLMDTMSVLTGTKAEVQPDYKAFLAGLLASPKEARFKTFAAVEYLLKSAGTYRGDIAERPYQVGLAHIGAEIATHSLKSAEGDDKSLYGNYALHFAALESLYSGIRTNTYIFAIFPEQATDDLIHNLAVFIEHISDEDLEKVRVRDLFEGRVVTPIEQIADNSYYFTKLDK